MPTMTAASPDLHIGLMSGTSLDGVDAVLVDFAAGSAAPGALPLQVRAHDWRPFPPALREQLLALNQPGANELHRAAQAAHALAGLYAEGVDAVLRAAGVAPDAVRSIGAHGQTVRHQPRPGEGASPYTWQLNAPAVLAERCGIDVIADFRSRDLAAGGQGAPLVPAVHQALFARPDHAMAVLNIGGFANVTLLPPTGQAGAVVRAFDCGPGNVLLDGWIARHLGQDYDRGGAWAASGRVLPGLLDRLLADPYFHRPPPKSTGRDDFHLAWLDAHLAPAPGAAAPAASPADVQATLAELTARSCADAVRAHGPDSRQLVVCGGGALNGHLMRRLAALLPGVAVRSSADAGLPPTQVEAVAFAWLARAHLRGDSGNLPDATGAVGPRILGARYPR